jgi:hypothetical protein
MSAVPGLERLPLSDGEVRGYRLNVCDIAEKLEVRFHTASLALWQSQMQEKRRGKRPTPASSEETGHPGRWKDGGKRCQPPDREESFWTGRNHFERRIPTKSRNNPPRSSPFPQTF